jgi:ketosteroid isomerase-like protein
MAEADAAWVAEEMWRRMGAGDLDGARALLHDDYVQEWPQSGERIEGADDAMAINRNFPGGLPSMRVLRVQSAGNLATLEVELRYADGSVYQGVSIMEVRDGKVAREIDYFAQPFEAPQWRAQWVRRIQ